MRARTRNGKKGWKAAILVVLCLAAVRLSGQETRKAIVQPAPAYPPLARQYHLSGTVKVEVVIAPDGQIKATKVMGGNALLADAALEALRKWKFAPANAESTQVLEFTFKP